MKDVVSFETAKRMKDAGFPQPEYEVHFNDEYTQDGNFDFDEFSGHSRYSGNYFAPTATDILKELGGLFDLRYRNGLEGWELTQFENQYSNKLFMHDNPAEACAAAWLSIHEKTANQ